MKKMFFHPVTTDQLCQLIKSIEIVSENEYKITYDSTMVKLRRVLEFFCDIYGLDVVSHFHPSPSKKEVHFDKELRDKLNSFKDGKLVFTPQEMDLNILLYLTPVTVTNSLGTKETYNVVAIPSDYANPADIINASTQMMRKSTTKGMQELYKWTQKNGSLFFRGKPIVFTGKDDLRHVQRFIVCPPAALKIYQKYILCRLEMTEGRKISQSVIMKKRKENEHILQKLMTGGQLPRRVVLRDYWEDLDGKTFTYDPEKQRYTCAMRSSEAVSKVFGSLRSSTNFTSNLSKYREGNTIILSESDFHALKQSAKQSRVPTVVMHAENIPFTRFEHHTGRVYFIHIPKSSLIYDNQIKINTCCETMGLDFRVKRTRGILYLTESEYKRWRHETNKAYNYPTIKSQDTNDQQVEALYKKWYFYVNFPAENTPEIRKACIGRLIDSLLTSQKSQHRIMPEEIVRMILSQMTFYEASANGKQKNQIRQLNQNFLGARFHDAQLYITEIIRQILTLKRNFEFKELPNLIRWHWLSQFWFDSPSSLVMKRLAIEVKKIGDKSILVLRIGGDINHTILAEYDPSKDGPDGILIPDNYDRYFRRKSMGSIVDREVLVKHIFISLTALCVALLNEFKHEHLSLPQDHSCANSSSHVETSDTEEVSPGITSVAHRTPSKPKLIRYSDESDMDTRDDDLDIAPEQPKVRKRKLIRRSDESDMDTSNDDIDTSSREKIASCKLTLFDHSTNLEPELQQSRKRKASSPSPDATLQKPVKRSRRGQICTTDASMLLQITCPSIALLTAYMEQRHLIVAKSNVAKEAGLGLYLGVSSDKKASVTFKKGTMLTYYSGIKGTPADLAKLSIPKTCCAAVHTSVSCVGQVIGFSGNPQTSGKAYYANHTFNPDARNVELRPVYDSNGLEAGVALQLTKDITINPGNVIELLTDYSKASARNIHGLTKTKQNVSRQNSKCPSSVLHDIAYCPYGFKIAEPPKQTFSFMDSRLTKGRIPKKGCQNSGTSSVYPCP